MKSMTLSSYHQAELDALHITFIIKYFTFVLQLKISFRRSRDFRDVEDWRFLYELIDYRVVQFFHGRDERLAVFKTEQYSILTICMFNDIYHVFSKEVVIWLCESNLNFVFW